MPYYYKRLLPGFAIALTLLGACNLRADQWQPVSQEEIKMTSEPKAPGAPAIYLYRQVDRFDDQPPHEFNYARIKILSEEGRKYADIEIPFNKGRESLHGLKARTIQPDGSIVPFDGKVYDKTIVKARGWRYLAKTFSMPDVRVGSIIEYYYTLDLQEGYVFDSRWTLSSELFTKRAKFSLKAYPRFVLRWAASLPPGTDPPKDDAGTIRLQTQDVPAFHIEDYMPPENELKFRVEFIYSEARNSEKEPAKFWKSEGKRRYEKFDSFINKRKDMEEAVSQIVSPNDSPEVKLQKIYGRVQHLRNTSFERERTKEELKREGSKENNNVGDVWKRGVGDWRQINWLFIALARAAGFEAYDVDLSARDRHFFHLNLMNPYELNAGAVLVKLNGKDLYLDPGMAFAPFGLLPWSETGVQGLRLDKDGGSWIETPVPESADSTLTRKAELTLNEDGSLEGALTVTYSGLQALYLRYEEKDEDETSRNKFLEDLVREAIPAAAEVEVTNKPDWTSSSLTFVAQYRLKVPGWVSAAGRRVLFPVGLFSSHEKHLFEHSVRIYPVYFRYPYQKQDDVTVVMPVGWKVGTVPAPVNQDTRAVAFLARAEDKQSTLHITRTLRSDLVSVDKSKYDILRSFFQLVRSTDEQQVILQPGA